MKSEYLDLFDGYFSGYLEEQGRLNIENQLKIDSKFKEAFNEYKILREGIDYSIMKTLKEDLQALEETLPEVQIKRPSVLVSKEPAINRRFTLLKVAAVVILVAVSTVVIFRLGQPTSPQDLYAQYFEPYNNEFVSPKRGTDQSIDLLVQSFREYDNGNYPKAIEGFTQILEQEENAMVLFYLGNAQLAQHNGQAAIISFERFLKLSQDFTIEAKWYLALSYLKEGRVEEAKVLLVELENNEEIVQQAGKILRSLK